MTEYEQLQNELLMKDMELRQSYVKESVMNEAATLRQAWQQQLAMKRKTDVVHKVNDDIITNVGIDGHMLSLRLPRKLSRKLEQVQEKWWE